MTIRELVDEFSLSQRQSRVLRKIDYDGYMEFKLLFKKEQTETEPEIIDDISVAEAFLFKRERTTFKKS